MTMDTDQIYTAEYFANWTDSRLNKLILLPPYEPKDRQSPSQWVTGSIRTPTIYDTTRTFTVTGPRMKVCFGGCNWNRVVFAMDSDKPEVVRFEQWMHLLADHVRIALWADPSKYKPGAISNSRFTFDADYIKPANDPNRYPDELRCRLSTRRETAANTTLPGTVGYNSIDFVDADLFTMDEDHQETAIAPSDITAGSEMIPILKFTYYRNGERFGLNTTILKALVYPAERKSTAVDNRSWVFDMPLVDSA
jgi:hypothetical protein